MFPELSKYPYVCIDVETTGLKWWEDTIFGIALFTPDGHSYYWDIREEPEAIEYLKREVPKAKMVVNHNIKFDHHFLRRIGIELPKKVWCTQICACLINEHEMSFSLDALSKKYLGIGKDTEIYLELKELFGGLGTKNVQMKNIHRAPIELVSKYAKRDTEIAMKLYEWQKEEVKKQGLQKVLDLEMNLYPVVMDMETKGIRVDVQKAEEAMVRLTSKVDRLQSELDNKVGFECNVNARAHMLKLFEPAQSGDDPEKWYSKDGTLLSTTETGLASINRHSLEDMSDPNAKIVLDIRKLVKCRDTFIRGHILGHEKNGYVHPNINQTKGDEAGTGTGRLSYNSPALQQIPARDGEIAGIVRPLFLSDPGEMWGCWDYQQFEFRVFAHYINNPRINKMFNDDPNTDFHQAVADMTGLPRSAPKHGGASAKQVNLGMIFGMGGGRLAQLMKLPYVVEKVSFIDGKTEILMPGPEAEDILSKYHESIPDIKVLAKKASSIAKDRGHMFTLMGRHIRFPGGKKTYKASGLVYQGSSADCMKQKMVELHRYFKDKQEGRLLLSVHDEINCSLPQGDERMRRDISEIMERYDGEETPIKLRIPILTDYGQGSNWAVASGKGG